MPSKEAQKRAANKQPFDLKRALAGEAVIDGEGDFITRLIMLNATSGEKYPLFGEVTGGYIESWSVNGRTREFEIDYEPTETLGDLFMVGETKC